MVCDGGIALETAAASRQPPRSLEPARNHAASPLPHPRSAPPRHARPRQEVVRAALALCLLQNHRETSPRPQFCPFKANGNAQSASALGRAGLARSLRSQGRRMGFLQPFGMDPSPGGQQEAPSSPGDATALGLISDTLPNSPGEHVPNPTGLGRK